MKPNKLRALWKQGKPATMGWCNIADTLAAEYLSQAGFDALLLDMQHGFTIGPDRMGAWMQAVKGTDTVPLARVPWNEPFFIQWVLDAGAYGVIVPMINSYEDAVKAGAACRYAQQGIRSVGGVRARLANGPDYDGAANDEVVCLVMIETPQAVERLPEILKAPGIDGTYIGPSDLARALAGSIPEGRKDPRHEQMCLRVLELTRGAGKIAGCHAANAEEAVKRFSQGFQISPVSIDTFGVEGWAANNLRYVREHYKP